MQGSEETNVGRRALIAGGELAQMLGVSTRTLYRMMSAGKLLRPVRLGGSVRWRLDEVREWIARGCPQADQWDWKSAA